MCLNISLLSFGQTYLVRHSMSWAWQGWSFFFSFLSVIKTYYLSHLCICWVLSLFCSLDLEQLEIEEVNEEVLRITDYLVGSGGRDGGSLCLLSAEDEIFFMCHQIFTNGASKPDNWRGLYCRSVMRGFCSICVECSSELISLRMCMTDRGRRGHN